MNKTELIDQVAKGTGLSKGAAGGAVSAVFDAITGSLVRGKDVTLIGFGTFRVSRRKSRMGRNPSTGEAIRIAAVKVPTFKSGKSLKDAVNKRKK